MSSAVTWRVVDRRGPATALFDTSWFDTAWFDTYSGGRCVARFHPTRPALVLGSSQNDAIVDTAEAERLGVDIVRRRSGGGAVWLDETLAWLDIVLPVGDPLEESDVQKAFYWLGDLFVDALRETDGDGTYMVHRGSLDRDPLNKLICFAGLGPGEVTRNGRKVVGISQRRTKRYTLFQCGVLQSWDPGLLLGVLRPGLRAAELASDPAGLSSLAAVLDERCVGAPGGAHRVVESLIARLP